MKIYCSFVCKKKNVKLKRNNKAIRKRKQKLKWEKSSAGKKLILSFWNLLWSTGNYLLYWQIYFYNKKKQPIDRAAEKINK